MRTLPGTNRDGDLVLDQLRRAQATLAAGGDALEYVEGIAETLAWAAGEMFEGPGSREPKTPTRAALESELPLVGVAALDKTSPAHMYGLGALGALEWLLGYTERQPVRWKATAAV